MVKEENEGVTSLISQEEHFKYLHSCCLNNKVKVQRDPIISCFFFIIHNNEMIESESS